mmetsp:Transcript_6311/g.13179  ORF Transcript_6311/g.13179 Transcript_6311/m.13179 type:complete len:866 (+) Transcript_6311:81-2678(+)
MSSATSRSILVPLVGSAAVAATGASSSGAAFLALHLSNTDQKRIRPPFSLSHATTSSTISQRLPRSEAAVHRSRVRKRSRLWMEPTDTDENTYVENDYFSETPSLIRGLDESASPPLTVNGKEAPAGPTRGLMELIEKIHKYCPDADDDMISKAYCFAENAHKDQKRKSGEPYFTHPLNVANIIADMKLDVPAVVTGLLHDTVEDCDSVSLEDVKKEFGQEVASLVDGVTKIGRIQFHSRQEAQAENYRKMIVAMAHDIRVILVKLADRTHNIRTLQYMTPKKQKEKAMETIDIFAPLAHRLGMHRIKEELEDTSLKYLEPKAYEELEATVAAGKEERQRYINEVINILEQILVDGGMDNASTKVSGRPKSYYSIYKKMKSQHLTFDSIQDLTAFRIIVDDISQCYQALGVVHMHFKPVPGRFKDYVALPKANGYQSLHTTVIGPDAKRIEIQIRTKEMHEMAENGVSSHWIYKGGNTAGSAEEAERFRWLKQLVEWVQEMNDPSEFIDSVKEDLFEKEVFVFSPDGELFALAKGSSVLDFAYRVHSDLGNTCVGGKINGRMVPMRHKMQNGDTVEVLTSTDQVPRREWLKFVRSSKAQARIRQWLKQEQRDESIALGRELLDKELRKQATRRQIDASKAYRKRLSRALSMFDMRDEEHLLSAIGYGQISVTSVVDEVLGISRNLGLEGEGLSKDEQSDAATLQLIEEKASQRASAPAKNDGIIVGGQRNVMIDFCKNCNPLMGEDIKGAITRGRGIKIHRMGCRYLLLQPEERRLDASWDTDSISKPSRPVQLDVVCEDQAGILASMSRAIAAQKFDIRSVNLRKLSNNRGLAKFEVMLSTVEDLERVVMQLQQEQGVISVERR